MKPSILRRNLRTKCARNGFGITRHKSSITPYGVGIPISITAVLPFPPW
jgi:hypothetical protein